MSGTTNSKLKKASTLNVDQVMSNPKEFMKARKQLINQTLQTFNDFRNYSNLKNTNENPLNDFALPEMLSQSNVDPFHFKQVISDRLARKAALELELQVREKSKKEILKMAHLKHAQNIVNKPTTMIELMEFWRKKMLAEKFAKDKQQPNVPVKQDLNEEIEKTSTETDSATDSDPDDGFSAGGGIELNEETIDIKRDSRNEFKPLEKWFGVYTCGQAFGESPLLQPEVEHSKFYSAIAIADTTVLQITKHQYETILKDLSERQLKVKKTFLTDFCPEFAYLQPKLKTQFCQMLEKESFIKNHVMYAEGELCKKIWIILDGEVKIEKRVNIAHKNA